MIARGWLALSLLGGCAADGGAWPSLARRPIEVATADAPATPAAVPRSTAAPPPAANASASPRGADPAAQLAGLERDLGAATKRWRAQAETTRGAVAAARGAAEESDRWSDAQVELSRLEQAGAQLDALRARFDGVAGDLALASADGAADMATLARVGAALVQLEALRVEHRTAFAAARAGLSG